MNEGHDKVSLLSSPASPTSTYGYNLEDKQDSPSSQPSHMGLNRSNTGHIGHHQSKFIRSKKKTLIYYILAGAQFLFAIGCPTVFMIFLASREGMTLADDNGKWATQDLRYTLMAASIVAACFTWICKNLWSKVLGFFAEKRSLDYTELAEIEALAALRSGTIVREWKRPHYTLMTGASAVLLALLNTAFTTLLTPLPITTSSALHGWEVDFLSPDSSCPTWFTNNDLHPPGVCDWIVSTIRDNRISLPNLVCLTDHLRDGCHNLLGCQSAIGRYRSRPCFCERPFHQHLLILIDGSIRW